MGREGVRILLALESRLKPPPTEEEAKELVEFFCGKQEGYGEPPLYGGDPMPIEEEEDGTGDRIDDQDIESP